MDDLLNNEPDRRAQDALKRFDNSLNVQVLEKTARTAKDASLALGCEVGAIVKSLLFRAENSFILCLVSGDKKCSLNKLKKITQKNDLCMASPDQVKTQTGYTIGGVSPVGLLNEIEIFMDNTLKRFEILYAAAGHPNCIFEINFKKLNEITSSKVLEITE